MSSNLLPCSGAAVHGWLTHHDPALARQFEEEFHTAVNGATTTFDLSPAQQVVHRWWLLAVGRSHTFSPPELDQIERARTGDLTGLTVLGADRTARRIG